MNVPSEIVHTIAGDENMNRNQTILTSLLKTAQLGQVDIRSLLDTAMTPQLRSSLEAQLREYEAIETEAHVLALQRGWELKEMDTARRFLRDRMTRMKLSGRNNDSRIADLLIQTHTKGMIRGLQELNRFPEKDSQIRILSQKLLDCENAGIRQMQTFL